MTYYVYFKTMDMTFCAGMAKGPNLTYIKPEASRLVDLRRVKHLQEAWIDDENGNQVAILNMNSYHPLHYEWLTIHS